MGLAHRGRRRAPTRYLLQLNYPLLLVHRGHPGGPPAGDDVVREPFSAASTPPASRTTRRPRPGGEAALQRLAEVLESVPSLDADRLFLGAGRGRPPCAPTCSRTVPPWRSSSRRKIAAKAPQEPRPAFKMWVSYRVWRARACAFGQVATAVCAGPTAARLPHRGAGPGGGADGSRTP
ncbi:hypothetical protein QJS66_11050 [Kocuria rhizophila]|nr:hypothetical protein QJS66_11050 [Kocuria rhizophila]